MGDFKTWAKKEPPLLLEKQKIEQLLNQTLSDEEFKSIVEPTPEPLNELEEYEPVVENTPAKIVPAVPATNPVTIETKVIKVAPEPSNESSNQSSNEESNGSNQSSNKSSNEVSNESNQSSNESSNESNEGSNESNQSSNEGSSEGSNEESTKEAPASVKKISFKKS
jgi:hypothetical protein